MGHTPYGYKIENGCAVIDEENADKIRKLYSNYLTGMALAKAALEAGIDTYHGTAKRMMGNRHYLGDDFYPVIIDKEIFGSAAAERMRRANKLGRLNYERVIKPSVVPTHFHLAAAVQHYDDPRLQAEYIYSLIESEVV
jgi:hypothetical protein